MTSHRLVFHFNEEVQLDLLFVKSILENTGDLHAICHVIDVCTRFAQTGLLPKGKDEIALTTCISRIWLAIFGPMTTLVVDGEAGLSGRFAADWASANGITIKIKALRQKALIIERHNALLRDGLHHTELQLQKEGIFSPFEATLSITTFSLNALTVINTSTPYQAAIGHQPTILPPLEGGYTGQRDDELGRPGTAARNVARIKEISSTNIIEATARRRIERANASRTLAPIEAKQYQPGEEVDVWFDPSEKDLSGWRGPGQVATVNSEEANITVRYQGKSLERRHQEVRVHIPYFVFAYLMNIDNLVHYDMVRDTCEQLNHGSMMTVGLVWSQAQNGMNAGWRLTSATSSSTGSRLLHSGLAMATAQMKIAGVTTI